MQINIMQVTNQVDQQDHGARRQGSVSHSGAKPKKPEKLVAIQNPD
jgi:hypothetical protein